MSDSIATHYSDQENALILELADKEGISPEEMNHRLVIEAFARRASANIRPTLKRNSAVVEFKGKPPC